MRWQALARAGSSQALCPPPPITLAPAPTHCVQAIKRKAAAERYRTPAAVFQVIHHSHRRGGCSCTITAAAAAAALHQCVVQHEAPAGRCRRHQARQHAAHRIAPLERLLAQAEVDQAGVGRQAGGHAVGRAAGKGVVKGSKRGGQRWQPAGRLLGAVLRHICCCGW